MVLTFSPEQFAILHTGFAVGDPSDAFEPHEMPVPVDSVTQLHRLFSTAHDNSLELSPALANVLEDCFVVGAEGNPRVSDYDYKVILNRLKQAQSN